MNKASEIMATLADARAALSIPNLSDRERAAIADAFMSTLSPKIYTGKLTVLARVVHREIARLRDGETEDNGRSEKASDGPAPEAGKVEASNKASQKKTKAAAHARNKAGSKRTPASDSS